MSYRINFYYIFLLTLIIIFSHFIPFERVSLSPDDYSIMNKFDGINNFLKHPDRPLLYLFLELLYFLFEDNVNTFFILLVLTNIINIIIIFFFYNLFFNKNTAFIISIINSLLFLKLEIFHSSIMIHILVVSSIYILCLYFLINFFFKKKIYNYFISLILYVVSILWYEIGFFLPLIFLFCKFDKDKFNLKQKIIFLFPFFFLMIFYILFRIYNSMHLNIGEISYQLNFSILEGFLDIFNHLFGRYAIKNILYGFYQFVNLPIILLLIFITLNIIFSYLIFKYFKFKKIKFKYNFFFIFLFIFSLIPIIINGESGGRNHIISSISISYFIYLFINYFSSKGKFILFFLIPCLLIIAQGNSWSHVISSRIQYSILDTIEKEVKINKSKDNIIFNPSSLVDNINHSFVNNEYNLLNTYYGAQVWEIWGINGFLNKKKINKKFIIIKDNPIIFKNIIEVNKVISVDNYQVETTNLQLNKENFIMIDFEKIYNLGFKNGFNRDK
jgi:hypothetical protein